MSAAKNKRPGVVEYSPDSGKGRSKKRRFSCDDHEEDEDIKHSMATLSKLSKLNGLRTPAFTHQNKPAELFRKDLISAMKLADSEQLAPEEYLQIQDPWRQDWEKGVQVPVNPDAVINPKIKVVGQRPKTGDFKIPRKFLHAAQDDTYKQGQHELTGMQQLSEQVVRYDLDDLDASWLQMVNDERAEIGEIAIHEWTMERIMEELEKQCHEKMDKTIKTEEGLGIEYDEDVICDVCRSPESEDNNEMVFCDGCDICVHQACYGIQKIPEGSWLCRICALGIKPTCILCPKAGGAMKSTKSGTKWSHVSCALWIPEVSIGCVEKMEPITKISQIPVSRWSLVCCICKERTGACIQCSVKTCKTAFHVTCGISNNLDMRTILDDSDEEDGVKLKAFCPKHTKGRDRTSSDSDMDSPSKEKSSSSPQKKDLTNEEEEGLRKEKLKQLQVTFYTLVDVKKVADVLQLPPEVVDLVFNFWKLKRKSLFDGAMLTPKTQEAELLEKQQEDSLVARMKMFVHLRQDLERVRNLCYMVSRREKMKRSYRRLRENVFMTQVKVLSQANLSTREINRVKKLYFDHSCYRPVNLQAAGSSSDEAPPTNSQDRSLVSFSREGTPLSSCSIASEPEVRKSSRRRVLTPKMRDLDGALSDTGSQDGSTGVSAIDDPSSYDSDYRTPNDEPKTPLPRKRGRPVNGKLSLNRRQKMDQKRLISDSGASSVDDKKTVAGKSEMDLDAVTAERENESHGKASRNLNNLSVTSPSSGTASPHTRSAVKSEHVPSRSPFVQSPVSEILHVKQKFSDDSLSSLSNSSPKRRVKSRLNRTPRLGLRDSASRNVHRTRQSPSLSPESVENKPSAINVKLKDITSSPVKREQFFEKRSNSLSPVTDRIKKELKDVFQKSQLVVDEKLREEVQERLLKSTMNGLHVKSPRRYDSVRDTKITRSTLAKRPSSFSQALTPPKQPHSGKVLNEISPGYTRTENKDWFGTNTSPRGSLSGYKIPKKSSRTPSESPVEGRDPAMPTSPLLGVLEPRNIKRRIEADIDKTVAEKSVITPEKGETIGRRLTRSHDHENREDSTNNRFLTDTV